MQYIESFLYVFGLKSNGIEKYGFRGIGMVVLSQNSTTSKSVIFNAIIVFDQKFTKVLLQMKMYYYDKKPFKT